MCSTQFPTSTLVFAYDPWPYILERNFRKIVGKTSEPFQPAKCTYFDYNWADEVVRGKLFKEGSKDLKSKKPRKFSIDQEWIEKNYSNKAYNLYEQNVQRCLEKEQRNLSSKKFIQLKDPWYIPEEIECMDAIGCGYFSKSSITVNSSTVNCDEFLEKMAHGYCIFIVDIEHISIERCREIRGIFKKAQLLAYLPTDVYLAAMIDCGTAFRTGRLLNNANGVYLERDTYIVVTTNRKYCAKCDHELIYITLAGYTSVLEKEDCLTIGCDICLHIYHFLSNSSFICIVSCPGLLCNNMVVNLPNHEEMEISKFSQKHEVDIECALLQLRCDILILSHYNEEVVKKVRAKNERIMILDTVHKNPKCQDVMPKSIQGYYIPDGWKKSRKEKFFKEMIYKQKLLLFADHAKVPRFDFDLNDFKEFDRNIVADLRTHECKFMIAIVNDSLPLAGNSASLTLKSILILRCFVKIIVILENPELLKTLGIFGKLFPFIFVHQDVDGGIWQSILESYLEFGIKCAKTLSFCQRDNKFLFLFPSRKATMSCDMWKILRVGKC